ncbi:MAG: endonuclease/exonuclease/phosphatase family protein [Microbacteriaceae bacterium]
MLSRIFAALVLVAAAVVAFVAAWPQLFGLQTLPGIAHVVSLRGLAIALALLAMVALLLVSLASRTARRFAASLALVFLVFALISAAVVSTRGLGDTAFETKGSNDLTVLTWNTLGDAPGAEGIAQLALDAGADIVVLPETSEEMGDLVAARLASAGAPMASLTLSYDKVSKARSTTVLISDALGKYTFTTDRTTSVLPTVVARPADGTGPTIIAVHAVAPIPGELGHWRSDLLWLRDACAGKNIIMAGDFNATLDHFAGLGTSSSTIIGDCSDAGLVSHNGAVGTWPTSLPALAGAPIDHVMQTANWRVSGMRVYESYDKYGSDHRPVVVQLSPAG